MLKTFRLYCDLIVDEINILRKIHVKKIKVI